DVFSPITVTGLGAFDSGLDGIAGADGIRVGIFDRDSGSLVGSSVVISSGSVALGRSLYEAVSFDLGTGLYSVVAVGFGDANPNGNTAFGGAGPTIDSGG